LLDSLLQENLTYKLVKSKDDSGGEKEE